MFTPEIHRTVDRVSLLEKLSFDLTISEEAYRSEHTLEGEIQVRTNPDSQVVQDRTSPPRHLLAPIGQLLREQLGTGQDGLNPNYPATTGYVAVAQTPPGEQDDDLFQDNQVARAITVDGIPTNGTVEFDLDWSVDEAERTLEENETRIQTQEYDVEGLVSDRLPIIVRASLERDAAEYIRRREDPEKDKEDVNQLAQRLEGQALLEIELEHRPDDAKNRGLFTVEGFQIQMSRTFPQIEFDPQAGSYNPESKRVKWGTRKVSPGSTATYRIIGPISELLSIDTLEAKLRGRIDGSMSGTKIVAMFDEAGEQFIEQGSSQIHSEVTVTSDIEIDPSALHGEAQEVSRASITVNAAPKEIYQKLADICRRNSIHIQHQSSVGDADPVPDRDGVYSIGDDDAGEYEVRREYGDRGVVYATLTVTGEYAAISEESQVSARDASDDKLVRADDSGISTRGRTIVDMRVRSASPTLNSEFVTTLEDELDDQGGAF